MLIQNFAAREKASKNLPSFKSTQNVQLQANPFANAKVNQLQTDAFQLSLKAAAQRNNSGNQLSPLKTFPLNHVNSVISFGASAAKNKNQIVFIFAEHPDYDKVGGVGDVAGQFDKTVFNEYDRVLILPLYNQKVEYDAKGEPTGKVELLTKEIERDGKKVSVPIYTKANLKEKKVSDLKPGDYWELEEVQKSKVNMDWAAGKVDVRTFQVKNSDGSLRPHYMVFTPSTAKMPRPYDKCEYRSGGSIPADAKGDPYAQFDKASIKVLPTLEEKGVNPAHILLNDSQTAHVPEYIEQEINNGNEFYAGADKKPLITPTFVEHNAANGYIGDTTFYNLFRNYASEEHINLVENDPKYHEALLKGETEKYYRGFFPSIPENKGPNARELMIHHLQQGSVPRADTVSEDYAERMANDDSRVKALAEQGRYGGKINGFADPYFDLNVEVASKDFPLFGKDADGKNFVDKNTKVEHKPFEVCQKDMTPEEILGVKARNKVNLLNRFREGAEAKYAAGTEKNAVTISGHIDEKYINENTTLFVGLGRGDKQKGHDTSLMAFEKIAKTDAGKNSVLILGAGLDPDNPESKIVKDKFDSMLKDKDLQGRIVLMDGWAPAKAFFNAADATLLPARHEPCGLTDFQAMTQGCTPIVSNVDGQKQKNFDPRTGLKPDDPNFEAKSKEALEKATSYKTFHQFNMSAKELLDLKESQDSEEKAIAQKFHDGLYHEGDEAKKIKPGLITAEKKKLLHRGVAQTDVEKLAEENVKHTNAYDKLFRNCKDQLIAKEIAQGMMAKLTETKEVRHKMLSNCLNLPKEWHNNGAFRPLVGNKEQSTKEGYIQDHLGKEAQKAEKTFYNASKINEVKARVDQAKAARSAAAGSSVDANKLNEVASKVEASTKKFTMSFESMKVKMNDLSQAQKPPVFKIAFATAAMVGAGAFIYKQFIAKPKEHETK
jgi:glycosyltransferase involved in cell wall biosynthesis